MKRRIFSKLGYEYSPLRERLPFWRAMSLFGWAVVFVGFFAGISFFIGLVFGITFFFVPGKFGSISFSANFTESPIWFIVLMAANGAVSFAIFRLFIRWLRERTH